MHRRSIKRESFNFNQQNGHTIKTKLVNEQINRLPVYDKTKCNQLTDQSIT
jgi:hypothetical protein